MPRRSAILTAAATFALVVALLTAASWLAGAAPANASPAGASVSAPHGAASASALASSPGVAASVAQQQPEPDEPTLDTTTGEEPASHDIVVRPDDEARPQRAEDRGGALQITVLLIVLGGIGTIAALAVRESRRRRHQTATRA